MPAPIPPEEVLGPPPEALHELPSRACAPLDLGGVVSLNAEVLQPRGNPVLLSENGLTLRRDGRYALGHGPDVLGCANALAATNFLRSVRALSRSTTRPEAPDLTWPWAIRLRWTTRDGLVEEFTTSARAYQTALHDFLAASPTHPEEVRRTLCRDAEPAIISFSLFGFRRSPVSGYVRADGLFWLRNGAEQGAGRYDPADVRRAYHWLRARNWEHVQSDPAGVDYEEWERRREDYGEYRRALERIFAPRLIGVSSDGIG